MDKVKFKLLCDIHKEGKKVLELMKKRGIDDIPIVCADPNNASLKGEDMKEG